MTEELLALGAESPLTAAVRRVMYVDRFPVDARHNAKIRREDLRVLVAKKILP